MCGSCIREDGYERPLEEPLFGVFPCIAEFWNTVSNAPFVVIGSLRLILYHVMMSQVMQILYGLYICAGVLSAFHHASAPRWRKRTIILDWLPILVSIVILIATEDGRTTLAHTMVVSWVKFAIAICILISDHLCLPIPPPWGHSFWHVLVAFSIDQLYADSILT